MVRFDFTLSVRQLNQFAKIGLVDCSLIFLELNNPTHVGRVGVYFHHWKLT